VFLIAALRAADAGAPDAGPPFPACVSVSTIVRYGALGYDHIVGIANGCAKRVECVVRTDVNPDPIHASVSPKEATEVVTWRGSPAREFKADVKCVGR
jgi:hypothetical protein